MIKRTSFTNNRVTERLNDATFTGTGGINISKPPTSRETLQDIVNLNVDYDGGLTLRKPLLKASDAGVGEVIFHNYIFDDSRLSIRKVGPNYIIRIIDLNGITHVPELRYVEAVSLVGSDGEYPTSAMDLDGISVVNTTTSSIFSNCTVDLTAFEIETENNVLDEDVIKNSYRYFVLFKELDKYILEIKTPEITTINSTDQIGFNPNMAYDHTYAIRDVYGSGAVSIETILAFSPSKLNERGVYVPHDEILLNSTYTVKQLTEDGRTTVPTYKILSNTSKKDKFSEIILKAMINVNTSKNLVYLATWERTINGVDYEECPNFIKDDDDYYEIEVLPTEINDTITDPEIEYEIKRCRVLKATDENDKVANRCDCLEVELNEDGTIPDYTYVFTVYALKSTELLRAPKVKTINNVEYGDIEVTSGNHHIIKGSLDVDGVSDTYPVVLVYDVPAEQDISKYTAFKYELENNAGTELEIVEENNNKISISTFVNLTEGQLLYNTTPVIFQLIYDGEYIVSKLKCIIYLQYGDNIENMYADEVLESYTKREFAHLLLFRTSKVVDGVLVPLEPKFEYGIQYRLNDDLAPPLGPISTADMQKIIDTYEGDAQVLKIHTSGINLNGSVDGVYTLYANTGNYDNLNIELFYDAPDLNYDTRVSQMYVIIDSKKIPVTELENIYYQCNKSSYPISLHIEVTYNGQVHVIREIYAEVENRLFGPEYGPEFYVVAFSKDYAESKEYVFITDNVFNSDSKVDIPFKDLVRYSKSSNNVMHKVYEDTGEITPEGDYINIRTSQIQLDRHEYDFTIAKQPDFLSNDLGNSVSGYKLYHKNKLYSFKSETYLNNIFPSNTNSFTTPLFNVIDLSAASDNRVTALVSWRDYLIAVTNTAIYMITQTDVGYTTKTVNTFIGIPLKDSLTCKSILNGIIFKSGSKIYSLQPSMYSSDDSILNITEISIPIATYLVDTEYENFAFTTEEAYFLFIPGKTTTCFKYEYTRRIWIRYVYPVTIINYHIITLDNIRLFDIYGNEYYFEKELHEVVKLDEAFKNWYMYGDYLEKLPNGIDDQDTYFRPQPIDFYMDTGNKTDDLSTTKQFVESKILISTKSANDKFPMELDVRVDEINLPVHIQVATDSAFWNTAPVSSLALGHTPININGTDQSQVIRQLLSRYASKGKVVRHILKGSSQYNFKIYVGHYRYKILKVKQ